MQEGEEVACGFVVPGGDASALFELREQTFDVIAFPIQLFVVRSLNFAVALGRNDHLAALIMNDLKHLVTVVALVGDHLFRRQSLQQCCGLGDVVCLTGRQPKLYRVAETVAGRMDLRAESAARPTELLIPAFFRAPAA